MKIHLRSAQLSHNTFLQNVGIIDAYGDAHGDSCRESNSRVAQAKLADAFPALRVETVPQTARECRQEMTSDGQEMSNRDLTLLNTEAEAACVELTPIRSSNE